MEMIAAILFQLTKNLSPEEIKKSGFDTYFVDHTAGIYPVSAAGVPFSASYFAVKGDLFADLHEDLAAEQKARVTYDNILRLVDDPDVRDPIKYLRQREINHFQRFGDTILTLSNKISPLGHTGGETFICYSLDFKIPISENGIGRKPSISFGSHCSQR